MKPWACTLVGLCLSLCATRAVASVFEEDTAAYRPASVAYLLEDAQSGGLLLASQPERVLASASLAKLITTATALEVLGPDYRFDTWIFYTGTLRRGQLDGDVWILPLGDPTLGAACFYDRPMAFLDEWTGALQRAGIKTVHGSLRLLSCWADPHQPVSPYWLWEDLGNYFAAGVYSAAIYENSLDLYLNSAGVGERVSLQSVYPRLPAYSFDVQAIAADNSKDSAYVYGAPYATRRAIYGSIPAERNSFRVRADNPNPPASLRWLWQEHLRSQGIVIDHPLPFDQGVVYWQVPDSLRSPAALQSCLASLPGLIHRQRSLPLSEVIALVNKRSHNLTAEYLARHCAWHLGASLPLTASDGLQALGSFWQDKGIDMRSCQLRDACGLAPQTAFSPRVLADILRYMSQQSRWAEVYVASLPRVGHEGTVRSLKPNLPGDLRLKSGSMYGVRCYAGYYSQPSGRCIVVLMTNRVDKPTHELLQDIQSFLKNNL